MMIIVDGSDYPEIQNRYLSKPIGSQSSVKLLMSPISCELFRSPIGSFLVTDVRRRFSAFLLI
jgi:hypothetical protein